MGNLTAGNVLVSNFNNAANAQGTGSTIVQVTPGGRQSVFATVPSLGGACPGGIGLTTALVALPTGWVIVGSLPTQNGMISGPGCLIVLDSHGVVRETFTGHGIDGPVGHDRRQPGQRVRAVRDQRARRHPRQAQP
jgi:hypothetical protein